jgi:GT2 family glycosyltransferase
MGIQGDPTAETIGVLIPTYRRPDDVRRCLSGVAEQTRAPDDVIVVVRRDDTDTQHVLAHPAGDRLPLRVILVDEPGTVVARNAGIGACRTDVLAMIDDDAVPHPDWLHRILGHFQRDPSLGGVGGKDRMHDGTGFDDARARVVGKIQWFGREIGNHHRGFGDPREVDGLKGANMSFRSQVFAEVRFDKRLRGSGATPNEDLRFSLAVKQAGWKLLYDPQILVDHYQRPREEPRFYGGVIVPEDATRFKEFAFNEVVAIWDSLSLPRRVSFAIWSVLIGTGVCPGLVQAVRYTPSLGIASWHRLGLAQRGKLEAIMELGWRRPKAV